MAMTFQQEFPDEFIDGSKDNVIELPQEYINWLDEAQDLGILISLATSHFMDACDEAEIPSGVSVELITSYGKALIAREMGRHPQE